MAKCKKCNKKGIFFKVQENGICFDCNRINNLIAEEKRLSALLSDENVLYESIKDKAKDDAIRELENIINKKNNQISVMNNEIEKLHSDIEELSKTIDKQTKSINLSITKIQKLKILHSSLEYAFDRSSWENKPMELDSQSEDIYKYHVEPTVKLKLHSEDIKDLRKRYNENYKLIQKVLEEYSSRYNTITNKTIYKLMSLALESELQNILYNLSYSKLDKSIESVKEMTAKFMNIAVEGNQSIRSTVTKFIGQIEFLFIEGVKIEYAYYVQKERIKEEQRIIREQMKQEAEERKALEDAKKKVEIEESKYTQEINNINLAIQDTKDTDKILQLTAKIETLKIQLEQVEKKKEEIINLQHGKAGYVYIISNLGSFGDQIFKIGMTRRLDPQDRIDELGNASVPFPYDVHSFIFSDNAVSLEQSLHKALHEVRLNKVNLRKEFFKITIDELKELVEERDPSASFNKTMLAEQYNQSLALDAGYFDDQEDFTELEEIE